MAIFSMQQKPEPRLVFTMKAAGLFHVLFTLSFLVILIMAATQAQAETKAKAETTVATADSSQPQACGGINLLEKLARENPRALEKIRLAASRIPNGDALLWRIEKSGYRDSWLYGTMHVSDPRVMAMSEAARNSYEMADTIVVESTEITDMVKAQAALLANPALSMLPEGSTLQTLLKPDEFQLVETVLKERGVPIALVSRLQPWMIYSMIAIPQCELARMQKNPTFLDKKLADDALAQGKALKGLETLAEQIGTLTDLPIELQVRLLTDTVALGSTLDDVMKTMTELYIQGQTGMIMPMIEWSSAQTGADDNDAYAEIEKQMVHSRNHTMVQRLAPMLEDGNAFVAVGALHLPGNDGLVQLLRDSDYTVTAMH